MVAAQWGETRDADARTGGGVSGRFRLLGSAGAGPGEAPDTTPPPFGTTAWGYRKSEVDAWASWVAGLVAHGRNETVRADSAEATLRATLERLQELERPAATPARAEPGDGEEDGGAKADRTVDGAPDGGGPAGGAIDDRAVDDSADESGPDPATARTPGRLHFDPPSDLPRRGDRGGVPAPDAPCPEGSPESDPAPTAEPTGGAPEPTSRDHDLARLHVVETTLHEVLGLLHHLADRK